jgi:hypothetical protein
VPSAGLGRLPASAAVGVVLMWVLFTGLLGPASDRRYSFWSPDDGHRGSGGGAGSWWMGYDFGRPRRPARPERRGAEQPERRQGWLL